MARPKKPRKAAHRPGFLEPFILLMLLQREELQPHSFQRHWINQTPDNGLPVKLNFSRQAVYAAFQRLAMKQIIRRVKARKTTFKLVDSDRAAAHLTKLWSKIQPSKPELTSRSQRLHERLKKSLEKTAAYYERLPPDFRRDLDDSVVEDRIFDTPFEGAISTREMLTLEEAEALQKRTGDLLEKKRFVDREKPWKIVPYKSRPLDWKKPSRKKPHIIRKEASYKPASKVPSSEHPLCHECGAKTVFDYNLGVYVCPKCGLEVYLQE